MCVGSKEDEIEEKVEEERKALKVKARLVTF